MIFAAPAAPASPKPTFKQKIKTNPLRRMLYSVLTAIGFHTVQLACHSAPRFEVANEVVQGRDGSDREPPVFRNLLNRRESPGTTLHPIQSNHHAARLASCSCDHFHRFAHRRSSRDDVIDDQDATGELCADELPALSMVLDFLSIERDGHIAPIFGKPDGGRGD